MWQCPWNHQLEEKKRGRITYIVVKKLEYQKAYPTHWKSERNSIQVDSQRQKGRHGCWNREEMLFIGIQMEDQVWSPAQLSPLQDTLRKCLFSWYAFLCVNVLENFDIFYICHNNIHGNDLLNPSHGVENLHLVCYTESLIVVLFLLPHKCGRDLK